MSAEPPYGKPTETKVDSTYLVIHLHGENISASLLEHQADSLTMQQLHRFVRRHRKQTDQKKIIVSQKGAEWQQVDQVIGVLRRNKYFEFTMSGP